MEMVCGNFFPWVLQIQSFPNLSNLRFSSLYGHSLLCQHEYMINYAFCFTLQRTVT